MKMKLFLLVICVGITTGDRRVINGTEVRPEQFPYAVLIECCCTGSIISNKHILTAAHCFSRTANYKGVVIAGTTNVNYTGINYDFKKYIRHPKFKINEHHHNIMVIQIIGIIQYSNVIQRVQLWTAEVKENTPVTVIGRGCKNCPFDGMEKKLLYGELNVIPKNDCKHIYRDITDDTFCVHHNYGRGLCIGDAGAPVVYYGAQVGIVSHGRSCEGCSPYVATKVSIYYTWINSAMKRFLCY